MNLEDRLLTTIIPLTYSIHLTPDISQFTFTGEEVLTFTLKKSTDTITLHAVELEIRSAVVEGLEAIISYDTKAKTVTLTFPKTLAKGEKKITISYTGFINDQLKGWYRSVYAVNGEKRFMATSHFEEIGARQVFPCIDDPSAKAIFQFSVTIPRFLDAISNTPPEKVIEKEKLQTITFAKTPKMSTYPLALIVGEFEYIEEKTKNGTTVRVCVTPGKRNLATFALDTALKTLVFYEEYFDIAYPLEKLDFIAIPDFDAGAMENWGAVTAREAALLIDEKKSSSAAKQWVATVIAHEITHMWFGDLVTLEWWTYLWLNEGFASYMEYMALHHLFPEWDVWDQFAVLDHNRALIMDSLEYTHPVETEITDLERLPESFDEISYSKGASVIYMLASFLGEEQFKKGVRAYLKKYAYGNARTEDLWDSLEKASGQPVRDIMHTFISESGHPIVSVSKQGNEVTLSQQRFFANLLLRGKASLQELWKIPFSVATSHTSSRKEYLMQSKRMQFVLPHETSWIKFNTNETSFVRAIYTKDLYESLKQPIMEKSISPVDRMGIVRDAFDGAEGGYITSDFALSLALSFKNENSYTVWASLAGKIGKVGNLLSTTTLKDDFDTYAQDMFVMIATSLGWEKRSGDSHTDILLRSLALYSLGAHGHAATIKKAQELFHAYLTTGEKIDNDIRGVVLRLVAENGTEKEFVQLKEMYRKESLHEEKNRIGNALCAFKNPVLVKQALEFSLTEAVRIQDIGRFIMLGFDNEKGREVTWEFVQKHWDYLAKVHEGQIGMSWLIEGAGSFVDEAKRKEIENFFAAHPTPHLTRTINQVLEQIESNVAWLKRDKQAIENFLKKRV